MKVVSRAEAAPGLGLAGDHFNGTAESKRQVTLIQHEHLGVIENIIGKKVNPATLRRNIVIKEINLLSLHNRKFRIGEVILKEPDIAILVRTWRLPWEKADITP